jgi:hypothetical protein
MQRELCPTAVATRRRQAATLRLVVSKRASPLRARSKTLLARSRSGSASAYAGALSA